MNIIEHLLSCLGEEGGEIAQQCSKINRFGIDDVNVLKPNGPTNRRRLVAELNDLQALVEMLIERRVLPKDWESERKKAAKKKKVLKFMDYARKHGTLTG